MFWINPVPHTVNIYIYTMKIQKIRGLANRLCDPRRSVHPPQTNRDLSINGKPRPVVWDSSQALPILPTYCKRRCSFSRKNKNSSTPENISLWQVIFIDRRDTTESSVIIHSEKADEPMSLYRRRLVCSYSTRLLQKTMAPYSEDTQDMCRWEATDRLVTWGPGLHTGARAVELRWP